MENFWYIKKLTKESSRFPFSTPGKSINFNGGAINQKKTNINCNEVPLPKKEQSCEMGYDEKCVYTTIFTIKKEENQ